MEIYGVTKSKSNKLMSYSRYDVDVIKFLINSYLEELSRNILDTEDEYMIQSVMSTIDDRMDKNNYRVVEVTAFTAFQCYESMAGREGAKMNYSNNNRLHMLQISESTVSEMEVHIPGLGDGVCIGFNDRRFIKNMKCKLGWIKSTNKAKVGC